MKTLVKKLVTVFIVIALLVGCSTDDGAANTSKTTNQNSDGGNSEEKVEATVHIIISQDNEAKVIQEKDVEIEEGAILLDVIKENFDVEEKDGFVNSIEGVNDNDGNLKKFWAISVNGEMAQVGAGDIELKDGDEVNFDFQSYE